MFIFSDENGWVLTYQLCRLDTGDRGETATDPAGLCTLQEPDWRTEQPHKWEEAVKLIRKGMEESLNQAFAMARFRQCSQGTDRWISG